MPAAKPTAQGIEHLHHDIIQLQQSVAALTRIARHADRGVTLLIARANGEDQAVIDALTDRLKDSTADLKDAVEDNTPV